MASIDFPNSPAVNDVFVAGNSSYRWTGLAWVSNNLAAITWTDITGKPTEFPPADHTHLLADITDYVEPDALPAQTGNNGKYLTTDGTDASWAAIDLSGKQDVVAGVSSTEIGYLDGVTSAIQPQLNSKLKSGWQTVTLSDGSPSVTITASSVLETRLTGTLSTYANNVILPDATTLNVGDRFIFRNNTSTSGGSGGIVGFFFPGSGTTTNLGSGAYEFVCIDNTSAGGPPNWQRTAIPNNSSSVGTGALVANTLTTLVVPTFAGAMEAISVVNSTAHNIDASSSTVRVTTVPTANFTVNFRYSGSVTLATNLAQNKAITFVVVVKNGATPYYPTSWAMDGTTFTPRWIGSAPSAGNANATDVYTITIMRTGASTYEYFGSVSKFA